MPKDLYSDKRFGRNTPLTVGIRLETLPQRQSHCLLQGVMTAADHPVEMSDDQSLIDEDVMNKTYYLGYQSCLHPPLLASGLLLPAGNSACSTQTHSLHLVPVTHASGVSTNTPCQGEQGQHNTL